MKFIKIKNMLGTIKKKIINIIGFSNYRSLLVQTMRIKENVHIKLSCSADVLSYEKYFVPGKDCFFGYYDLKSINNSKTKLLSHVIDTDIATIGYFDISSKKFYKISESKSWNWQMGARLRWYEDDKSVLFNDFVDGKFISRIVDLNGKQIKTLPFPIFDYDKECNKAYFTDFTILHHLRRGYGYSNLEIKFEEYYAKIHNGVFVADMINNDISTLVTIDELKKIKPQETMAFPYHYINHITVNPCNGDIMFFHIWTDKKDWYARMLFYNNEGELKNVIDDFDRVSHYHWYDMCHILVTLVIKGKQYYRLYNYEDGSYVPLDGISADGHPTILNNNLFVTDTYPNHYGMQSIYLCKMKEGQYKNVFSIFHTPKKVGEYRCDLHPRVCGNLINIDNVSDKRRSQIILKISENSFKTGSWKNKLSLDSIAYNREKKANGTGLYSCLKSEYLFATNRPCANFLKAFYLFLMSPTFRTNVYIAWMQKQKSLFKKRLIRNHLESHHAIIIDQRCQIGLHFRVDHPVGVVIGPGSKIGNFCHLYQNVTIGQKNGFFPIIGNNVTIYAGAKIIGNVKIGDNAVVGANAVVLNDVPANATAVGVPARNIL